MPLRDDLKPAPEDAPESAPELRGFRGFWKLMMSCFLELVKMNLLFMALCLPVVTVPLAVYALSRVVHGMISGEEVSCRDSVRTAFRCWRRGYAAFALTALPMVLGALGGWFYLSPAGESPLFYAPFLVCSTFLLTAALCSGHLYAQLDLGLPFNTNFQLK